MNPILDKDFLKQLDNINHKEIFARLTSLNFLEMPIEQIEGKITGGSINLDGSSSSRRTCSLTMVAKDVNINEFYWGLTHKIKIEIGVINTINPEYDDIVWFNQGIFIISTFNVALTVNNYAITLNAKDKMSLLNGDLGGNLFAQTDFANIENYDDIYEVVTFQDRTEYEANKYYTRIIDTEAEIEKYVISLDEYNEHTIYYEKFTSYSKEALPIKTIIREAIHTYAKEPYFNIIINDLDDSGVELLEYRGSDPLYMVYDPRTQIAGNMTFNGDMEVKIKGSNTATTLKEIDDSLFAQGVDSLIDLNETKFTFEKDTKSEKTEYNIRKIQYGQTAGFRAIDLVYAGELVGNIGETLTSVLDKIKNMLGDFEYFYDVDGHFVFQRQRTYENQSWNSLVKTEDNDLLIENAAENSAVTYSFIDNNIITAFNNTPNLSNLRNDFSIWGTRKGISGADIPVHLRFAIDTKPVMYQTFDGKIYTTDSSILIDTFKEQYVREAINEFYDFPRKENPIIAGKQQLPDDWWYMSDWYNYYLKLVGNPPTDYIRFYSTNRSNEAGLEKGYVENFDPDLYFETRGTRSLRNIWLFHLINGVYNYQSSAQHNSSNMGGSYREADGSVTAAPFSGCTSHKYTDFVTIDENGVAHDKPNYTGFFYKPSFPSQAITDEIEENATEYIYTYLKDKMIVCDWREIIYQMAKDYYKHNQDDDFYSTLQNNNGKKPDGSYYYPNGITGYEQYYIDIISFWRDLYNLDPDHNYYTFGGYYAEYIDWNQVNDFTYQIKTQWVGFEKDKGLFQSDYFIPAERKEYDDDMATVVAGIKDMNINLTGYIDNNNSESTRVYNKDSIGSLRWSLDTKQKTNLNEAFDKVFSTRPTIKYEIYRSFYPTSGYCKIYVDSSSTNTVTTGTSYSESNAQPFGSVNKDLPMYYKVRGFYEITVNGEIQKLYTQFSNRVNIIYHIEYELNDKGEYVYSNSENPNKWIYPIEVHKLTFTDSDRVPTVNIVAYQNNFVTDPNYFYWNKQVFNEPEKLNFWFDFLDSDSELAQYKVPVVGARTKAINDNKVTSIYFKETPDVIFYTDEEYSKHERQSGYTYFRIRNDQKNLFTISTQYKSAKDVLDEYLYKFSYCIENITITALPVYYLEPNTRIFVYDEDSQINGEYIVSKITLPLTYNGTMSITATKAVNRIY